MRAAPLFALVPWLLASGAGAEPEPKEAEEPTEAPSSEPASCTRHADCDGVCLDGGCHGRVVDPDYAPDTRYETKTYLPLLATGASVFGASWIATVALAGATAGDDQDVGAVVGGALVPAAGPLILRSEGTAPPDDAVNATLLALGGVQAMGLLTTVLGLTIDSRVEVPDVAIAPSGSPHGAGVVAVGRF